MCFIRRRLPSRYLKRRTKCRKLSADEFNHVKVVAERLTSAIEQMAKIDRHQWTFRKTDAENPATI